MSVPCTNGLVAREAIIDCDDARCRLAYSVQGGPGRDAAVSASAAP